MESEVSVEGTSPVPSLLPLASDSQQPYVSELLSFTLDRLHKVPHPLLLQFYCWNYLVSSTNCTLHIGDLALIIPVSVGNKLNFRNQSFFGLMRSGFGGKCKRWQWVITERSYLLPTPCLLFVRKSLLLTSILNLWYLFQFSSVVYLLYVLYVLYIYGDSLLLQAKKKKKRLFAFKMLHIKV